MEQMQITHSEELYSRAKELMPGGVNSPVRAFQSVGGTPRFIQRAKDQYLYDEDGNAMYPLGESNRAKQQAAEQNNSEQ